MCAYDFFMSKKSLSQKRGGKIMKNNSLSILAVFYLLFFAIAAIAEGQTIKVGEKEGIGKYLTDAAGMTLYWYKKDSPNRSECLGACVERWPVFYQEDIITPEGLSAEAFKTITREDYVKQTTFRGFPLYYWIGDKEAGDTTGQRIGNVWFVVNPDNFPPK